MDHQKPTILLIFGTLSLGGCGGHPMRPKLNLKDKSQMSTPNEYTDNLKSNLICIFLSVRTKSKKPLCPRTQCRSSRWCDHCYRDADEQHAASLAAVIAMCGQQLNVSIPQWLACEELSPRQYRVLSNSILKTLSSTLIFLTNS